MNEEQLQAVTGGKMKTLLAVLFATLFAVAASADVYISMVPSSQTVAQGQTFDIEIWVPVADSSFNAIEATVGYDTTAILYVPMPQSFQEGPLIPSACGNTFYTFRTDTSRVSIFSSTLCNQRRLYGPGLAFRLRFLALTQGTTPLTFIPYACCWGSADTYRDRTAFYRGGFYVTPVHMSNATVTIVGPVGVPPPVVVMPPSGKAYDVMGRRVDPAARSGVTFGQRKRVRVK